MDDQSNRTPLIPISGILVFLAALGVIVIKEMPLQGTRPPAETLLYVQSETVRARLWQDPFHAIMEHAAHSDPSASSDPHPCTDRNNKSLSGKKAPAINPHSYSALQCDIAVRMKNEAKVTILGVMVFGSPYAEEIETRIRWRYAVLSALRRLDYVPEDPEHIGYIKTDDSDRPLSLTSILPYEWLEFSKNESLKPSEKKTILLLWLNDDNFKKKPLHNLAELVKELNIVKKLIGDKEQNRSFFKIIGPAGSTTLLDMLKELRHPETPENDKSMLEHVSMYSATATATDAILLENSGYRRDKDITSLFKKIIFVRTIKTDRDLAEGIIDELEGRKVKVYDEKYKGCIEKKCREKTKECIVKKCDPDNHVVLIAEWDTFYGRKLRETFEDVLCEKMYSKEECNQKPSHKINWIHHFSYLRGIDGKLPGEKDKDTPELKNMNDRDQEDIKTMERPTGKSQYDYLRRLEGRIYSLHRELISNGQEGIKAIGIMGSDVYDKLLVLQALKQRFPEAIFFTTDLDARLLHPANIKWTRNLVVASTYGLELQRDCQGDVPPFRDSYQTSIFTTALLAYENEFKYEECKKRLASIIKGGDEVPSRIYEIGRNGAYDLTGDNAPIHPEPRKTIFAQMKGFWWRLSVISAIVTFLFLLWRSSSTMRKEVTNLKHEIIQKPFKYISLLTLLSILLVFAYTSKEPFYWIAGISIWPTEILRGVAIVFSFFFIRSANRQMIRNTEELDEYFHLEGYQKSRLRNDRHCCMPIDPSWKNRLRQYRARIGLTYWNVEDCKHNTHVASIWHEYLRRFEYRNRRIWICLVLYMIFGISIMYAFGFPVTPVRDFTGFIIDKIIIVGITVPLFIYLTFFVVDTSRLCQQFISHFECNTPFWPRKAYERFLSKAEYERCLSEAGDERESLREWMVIRLISKLTETVGRLIFYPFIIWFIMFVSRSRLFDNWTTPIGLAVVITMGAVYAWSCSFVLRRSAERIRKAVIDRLSEQLAKARQESRQDQTKVERIQFVLNDVKAVRTGAFSPITQHPTIQALILPFGGIGGFALFEFLAKLTR